MGTRLVGVLLGVIVGCACADGPPAIQQRQYVCSGVCHFRNREGDFERTPVEGKATSIERAWRRARAACDDRGTEAELQVTVNEHEDQYRAASFDRDCREE